MRGIKTTLVVFVFTYVVTVSSEAAAVGVRHGTFANLRATETLTSHVVREGSDNTDVDGTPLPKFQIDLDLPPRVRWQQVMTVYRAGTLKVMKYLFQKLPGTVHAEVDKLVLEAKERIPGWAREEMQGVADILNVTLGDVFLVNLFFEITPFCTSIVTQSSSTGRIYHGRNMDFGLGMPELSENLREIAVDVEFLRKGTPTFIITTFAGYVGVATGMRLKDALFSITANEREMTGPVPIPNIFKSILNLVNALMRKDVSPVTWAVREVLENDAANSSFEAAVSALSTRALATQMYLIIGGTFSGQATVLTRDRNALLDRWNINMTAGGWFLVQTNYDHWLPMPPWDNRKQPAEQALKEVGAGAVSPSLMNKVVLSRDPVLNQLTVYTTIMSCSEGTYSSFVRVCESCSPFR